MTQPHDHDHGDPHAAIEDAGGPPSEFELLERVLRELLIEKGVFKAEDIRRTIDEMDTKSPADGARVVAHAWSDAAYKARLLDDAKAAVEELGFGLGPAPGGDASARRRPDLGPAGRGAGPDPGRRGRKRCFRYPLREVIRARR